MNIIHPTSQVSIIVSDEEVVRLKAKTDGSTCLVYTGFRGELEHLKVETRLIGESFECVMGECDLETIGDPSIFNTIRSE